MVVSHRGSREKHCLSICGTRTGTRHEICYSARDSGLTVLVEFWFHRICDRIAVEVSHFADSDTPTRTVAQVSRNVAGSYL
jgi:hypothetical protein